MDAYVYAVFVDGNIRYIGKGRGKRLYDHERIARNVGRKSSYRPTTFHLKLAEAIKSGSSVEARKIVVDVTDDLALEIERGAIAAVRKGQLWNTRRGGSPGISSEEAKIIQSSPERRLAASERAKALWQDDEMRLLILERQAEAISRISPKIASERVKALYEQRPEYRRKNKERWKDDEFRQRHRSGVIAAITPEKAQQFGDMVSELWKDKEALSRRVEKWHKTKAGKYSDTFEASVLKVISENPGVTSAELKSIFGGKRIAAATFKLLGKRLIEKQGGKYGRFYPS